MLTSKVTTRIELPHESGQWIEVRMPSAWILDKARRAQRQQSIAMIGALDASVLAAWQNNSSQIEQLRDDTPVERSEEYDWLALLQECITAWSYAEPFEKELVSDLDEVTVKVVIAVLVPNKTEADQKNASRRSTKP